MRKWNALLSMGILVLFLVHAIAGALNLAGLSAGGSQFMKVLAWVMTALIAAHTLIGIKLTADTLRASKKSGVSYPKENRLFWLRRLSGFAIMLFIVCHLLIFAGGGENFRLHLFAGAELTTQILLVLSIAVHVLTNIKPLMLALGARGMRELLTDVLLVLTVLLLLSGTAFVVYYVRWRVF